MKHYRNILIPALLAPVLFALSSRGESPSFHPQEGTTLTKRFASESEVTLDEMSTLMNGEEPPGMPDMEMTVSASQTVAFTDLYADVGEGRPSKLHRKFDELSSSTDISMTIPGMGPQDISASGKSKLQGLTVVFAWNQDQGDFQVAFDDDSEGEEELLEGLVEDTDLRGVLPTEEVSEGDTWDVDPNVLRNVLAPGGAVKIEMEEMEMDMMGPQPSPDEMLGDFDGTVSARFTGSREQDGAQVGVIQLTVDVRTAKDLTDLMQEAYSEMEPPNGAQVEMEVKSFDVELSFQGEGELLWNMEKGVLHSLDLSGEVSEAIDMSMDLNINGQDMAMENSMALSGSQSVSVTTD